MNRNPPAGHPPDEELAARAATGSNAAFEALVSKYSPRLFFFLRRRCQIEADIEDLVQEAFLRAFQNIDRYNPRWEFSTWLYTTAFRLAVSRHRRKRAEPLSFDAETAESPSSSPQEALLRKEEVEAGANIWELARSLKPGEYEALWLRYAEEMPVKDIARAMGKSPVGIRVLLHRSRLKLGKLLRSPARSTGLREVRPVEQKIPVL
jgi:RNA polymerase sigma-70 factor (ECF subfamily)